MSHRVTGATFTDDPLAFYESGSVLLSGCLIGVTAGVVGQYLIDGWLHQTTDASVQFAPAWQLVLRTFAIFSAISLGTSLIEATARGK